jgi:predicted permease
MVADSGFLAAMGIPILLGRDLNDGDRPHAPMVAVVNETFVRDYFAGNNPLGKIFYFGQLTGQPKAAKDTVQIIGVCRDAKYTDLRSEIPPTAYLSYLQNADWVGQATFEVRTAVPPLSIANAVRRAVAETDRDVPVADLLTQEQQIRMSLSPERLAAGLIGSFGLIAALLAAIGLYGVMAYTVTRRTSEIGIRMALGAGCNDVLWMVLRGSLFMVAIGIGIGIPTALALTQVVREALYGIEPNDPVSFIAAGMLMLAVATAAAWIPALRAARVDPMQALRHE